jgi:hypothetical protein
MKSPTHAILSREQQERLDGICVRILSAKEDIERARIYLQRWHYLGDLQEVGERIWYAVEESDGQWSGVMVFCAAARHLRYRDQWIGWDDEQRRRRLALVVNQSRCLFFPGRTFPNLGTKSLRLVCDRLADDWHQKYQHRVLVVETFVDPEQFNGTLYTAGGWKELGMTQGNGRKSREYYVDHHKPKRLFVKELCKNACRHLQAQTLKPELRWVEERVTPRYRKSAESIQALTEHFKGISDYRGRIGRFPLWTLAGIVAMAHLCGACQGSKAIAGFAAKMSSCQLRMVGVRKSRDKKYRAPGQSTIWRFLAQVNSDELARAWQGIEAQLRGELSLEDELICVDGKEPKNGEGSSILTAISVPSQRQVGSVLVDNKTNEIPVFQQEGKAWGLQGARISLDALHTQHKTARIVVQEMGADYFMTVKKNQPTLYAQIESYFDTAPGAVFPPQATASHHV